MDVKYFPPRRLQASRRRSDPMHRLTRLCWAGLSVAVIATMPACDQSPAIGGMRRSAQILGDYDMEVRETHPRADGIRHVDVARTIAGLRQAHITTYFYLIFHAETDWVDLKDEFMPAAERAGIDVWIYLVPPSECCSKPFGTDFIRWSTEIARLSLRHRNLRGWAMDDFKSNLATFTPEYTEAMRSTARRINPELEFFPVLYLRDYVPAFLGAYAAHFDGVIFPYTVDFDDFTGVAAALSQTRAAVEPFGLDLILMVYATKMSVAPYPPSAAYVAGALRAGVTAMMRGEVRGVVTYAMAKTFQVEACGFAHHLNLTVPSETRTSAGDFVAATQTVRIDPHAAGYQLRFSEQDSYPIATAGYHFKQLLVNGRMVWSADVAADPELAWTEHVVDLTPYVKGISRATISFRLYDEKGVSNFGVRVSIAGISATGLQLENADFTHRTGWSFAHQGPASAQYGYHVCDPDRQRRVYEAVSQLYGQVASRDFGR
jgi:hypothetical protein